MVLSSLREGVPKTVLKAERWSITRKSAITQDYLEYSPKVIGSEITPRGMTESPIKPYTRLGEGFRSLTFSPILLNAWKYSISAELPLSTRILCTLLLATMALMTSASQCGWRT